MESKKFFKDKAFWGIMLVCLVAIAAIAGAISLDNHNKKQMVEKEETSVTNLAKHETEKKTEVPAAKRKKVTEQAKVQKKIEEKAKKKSQSSATTVKNKTNTEKNKTEKKIVSEKNSKTKDITSPVAAAVSSAKLNFTEKDKLVWPVEGQVLIPYSMDTTTFFPTLNEYKCSDAVVIQAAKDMKVQCAAKGVIAKKGTDDEIGNFVTVNMGNGYELTYGQLNECKKEIGEVVEKGDVIATVAEPSKYYSSEGYNVYLKLTQNGTTKDPLNQLDYDEKIENSIFYED